MHFDILPYFRVLNFTEDLADIMDPAGENLSFQLRHLPLIDNCLELWSATLKLPEWAQQTMFCMGFDKLKLKFRAQSS